MTAEEIIEVLDMQPLEGEGGMWKAMFRSDEMLPEGVLPGRKGPHALYGSIMYLLTRNSFSRMHRLATDEIWHFYMGDPCEILVLNPDGSGKTLRLGQDIMNGEAVTAVVPRGCWQGARIAGEGEWALLGTTMAPGYEQIDYEDGTDELMERYPEFREQLLILLGEASDR